MEDIAKEYSWLSKEGYTWHEEKNDTFNKWGLRRVAHSTCAALGKSWAVLHVGLVTLYIVLQFIGMFSDWNFVHFSSKQTNILLLLLKLWCHLKRIVLA